jgi:hypothetical protein
MGPLWGAGCAPGDVARTYAVDRRLAGWRPPALSSKARPPCEARQTLASGGRLAAAFRRFQVCPKDLRGTLR